MRRYKFAVRVARGDGVITSDDSQAVNKVAHALVSTSRSSPTAARFAPTWPHDVSYSSAVQPVSAQQFAVEKVSLSFRFLFVTCCTTLTGCARNLTRFTQSMGSQRSASKQLPSLTLTKRLCIQGQNRNTTAMMAASKMIQSHQACGNNLRR